MKESKDKGGFMDKIEYVKDTLIIQGEEIPVKNCVMAHVDMKFYPENPRIYSIVCAGEEVPSQEEIFNRLSKQDHVNQLVQSIKANGGLTDPLIVGEGSLEVFEGNSRLAAYKLLVKQDAIKWGKVKCKLLPEGISEGLIFALLGQYHIIGRKDWAPYEQAGYLWRRNKKQGVSTSIMAKEMGLPENKIKVLIKVYSYMVEHNDNDVQRWSYYDELLKSRPINKCRKEIPEFDKIIVKKIKKGEIPRAVDVRDKVAKICEVGKKPLKKFLKEGSDLDDCLEIAVARGVDNHLFKTLMKFRGTICDPDTKNDLKKMPAEQLDKCKYELKKIKVAVDKLNQVIKY